MENSFAQLINSAKSILVLLPKQPTFDQVASSLSIQIALGSSKQVQVSCPSQMTVEFNKIVGINRINQELGNKNLVIRFNDYEANNIERVSYDIEDGQFKLTVIPKQENTPPGKDQINLTYSGISADTVIILGGADESDFPAISSDDFSKANIIHIGTSDISLSSNKSFMSFSRPASSISEITHFLLLDSGFKVDPDGATNLLMGIEEETKNFSTAKTSSDTFVAVAELMRLGGKRMVNVKMPTTNFPPGSIPGNTNLSDSNISNIGLKTNSPDTTLPENVNPPDEAPQEKDNKNANTPEDWLKPKIIKSSDLVEN